MKIGINKELLKINKSSNKKNVIFSIVIIILLISVYFLLNFNTILYAYNLDKEVSESLSDMKIVLGRRNCRNKAFGNRCTCYGN